MPSLTRNVKVVEQIGYELVQLIESGAMHSEKMTQLLKSYLDPMVAQDIDYLVLGCTHYPYLIPQIKKLIPNHIRIIDSGEAVAKQTKHILEVNNLYNTSNEVFHSFFINNPPDVMQELVGTSFNVDFKVF